MSVPDVKNLGLQAWQSKFDLHMSRSAYERSLIDGASLVVRHCVFSNISLSFLYIGHHDALPYSRCGLTNDVKTVFTVTVSRCT